MIRFGESIHVVHGISPVDTTSSAVSSDVISAKGAQWVRFIVLFGTITGDDAVVTVRECSDAAASATTAIAFSYRKGAALGTHTMGAITAASTSGATMAAADDDKLLCIDIDPADLTDGYPYLRVTVTPGGSMSACEVACIALLDLRYPQNVPVSQVT
jgi:hypothetical protein